MPTDWKKYLPFLVIGGVAIWLILKLSKSGSVGQVVNRVIPVQQPNDSTALAQIQAQFELGKAQLANEATIANKQVDAERQRLEFANRALEIQGQYGLKGLEIQSAKESNQAQINSDLAKIALNQSGYETQLRANAATELLRQQQTSARNNQLLQLGSLLSNLLKGSQQSQSRSQGSSGGVTPSIGSPPFNPNARRATSSGSALQRALQNFFGYSAPLSYQTYSPLGYAQGYDLSNFDAAEQLAFDNFLNYDVISVGSIGNNTGSNGNNNFSDLPTFDNANLEFTGDPGSRDAYDFFGFDFN